jgi:subtilisin family serine protease
MDEPTFAAFGPDEDSAVPGEVLVKLAPGTEVSESIPTGPVGRVAGESPTTFGLRQLDQAAKKLKPESIVRVHRPVSTFTAAEGAGAALSADIGSTYRIRIADADADLDEAAETLIGVNAVVEASPNYLRYATVVPNDPQWGLQWGLVKIRCPDAWDRQRGSAAVTVAVVDTGVDLDHPDLAGRIITPGNDFVDMTGVAPRTGWHFEGDFLTRDNIPQDDVGHGTHVAGTIAALTDNGVGVSGVDWFCRILPVRVLARMVENVPPNRVTGTGTAADIAAGIRWAADNGANIINLSLGGYNDTFVERDAVAYAVMRGVLVVAAMGNDNTNMPSFPAAYPDVVAVGALTQSDTRATFSNIGPHIDVAAPGVGVQSTVWDNGYTSMSGTSMATPHVSGVAALIRACNVSLTAAQVAQILRDTARNLRDDPADPVPNNAYGFGLIDAKAAVDRACPPRTLKFIDDTVKAQDDITLKFQDDPTLKFNDDPTRKFLDDITIKAQDDITLKFQDDPTAKFQDDVTRKFQDDIATIKARDDIKLPQLDPAEPKPIVDNPKPVVDIPGRPPGGGNPGPAPFALATPHHSMAWQQQGEAGGQPTAADYEALLSQYEQALSEAEAAGTLGEQLEDLRQQYQALFAEYQELGGGQGGGGC